MKFLLWIYFCISMEYNYVVILISYDVIRNCNISFLNLGLWLF